MKDKFCLVKIKFVKIYIFVNNNFGTLLLEKVAPVKFVESKITPLSLSLSLISYV